MRGKKGSTFGLYVLGYFIAIAAYYLGNAVMAASKLGELSQPFFYNNWIVYGIMIVGVILEIVVAFIKAAGGK